MNITMIVPLMRQNFAHQHFCKIVDSTHDIQQVVFVDGNDVHPRVECKRRVRVVHLAFSGKPFGDIGSAERYLGGVSATEPFVLHVDEDLFELCAIRLPAMLGDIRATNWRHDFYVTPDSIRGCDHRGYSMSRMSSPLHHIGLTNMAIVRTSLHMNFVVSYNKYALLMESTKGNGEDILYAWHAYKNNVLPHVVRSNYYGRQLSKYYVPYSEKENHTIVRNMLCKLLFSNGGAARKVLAAKWKQVFGLNPYLDKDHSFFGKNPQKKSVTTEKRFGCRENS
jgi:hypothetical protein